MDSFQADLLPEDKAEVVLRLQSKGVHVVMVGDGIDLDKYVSQCRKLGLSDRVKFRSAMPTREAFALANTVVVPSRAEAMPYIVLESLAAGKPVIASAVGGIPEVFGKDSPALIKPDSNHLAKKMSESLRPETKYSTMMPDLAELKSRFGVDVMAARIEGAYFRSLGHQD